MPAVTISDELFEQLAKRAAVLNLTVEQLITPWLNLAVREGNGHPLPLTAAQSFDNWKEKFETWMRDVHARAHRYPPGFVLDDSRESIYEGCGQ